MASSAVTGEFMNYKQIEIGPVKKIALVAHDNKKQDLYEWAKFNRDLLAQHILYATGTTGAISRRPSTSTWSAWKAARSEEINKSALKSPNEISILSFSFGIHSNLGPTIQT
jgi:hypothetical protein